MIAAGNLGREPLRIAAGALVIAAACAALGEELALRWAFGGVLVGSFLGRPVSWQAGTPDVAAVVMMLAMATITIAGLVLSFAAAGLSAVTGHGTSILRLQRESRPAGRGER